MPAPSPSLEQSDLTSYTIKVGGSEIDGAYQVLHIEVIKSANRISSALVVISDGSAAQADFTLSDTATFLPGGEIEIDLGYHNANKSVFKGIILQQQIKKDKEGNSTLTLDCRDKAIQMSIGRKNGCYTQKKDSDIFSQIIGTYGLSAKVTATSSTLEEVVQYYCSDWDFLVSRAEINGLTVLVDAGTVTVSKPDPTQSPVLGVTYGTDIYEMSLQMDAQTQLSDIKCSAWDLKSLAAISADAKASNYNSLGNATSTTLSKVTGSDVYQLQTTAPLSQDELQAWADGEMLKAMMSKIRGTIRFQGSSLVNPGNIISIAGTGTRFSGNAYVGAVTHVIDEGTWFTEIEVGLPAEPYSARPDIVSPPASGVLPGIRGLQNGIVKQIDKDPDGEFRVLVTIPLLDPTSQGIWARLSSFYATNKAGAFFYPEIGDEVVLGFLNEDPRFPIILGSLYSSSKKVPPFTPDDKNTNKAIVTNSQLKFLFDDVKKIITLITPNKNQIVISDDGQSITIADQNSNSIKLSSSGIEIKGSKVTIQAQQGVEITTSTNNISCSASAGTYSVSALSISESAQGELTSKANGMATFESSGITTIKGSMVMIN